MLDRCFDYLAARPTVLALGCCLLLAMLIGWGMSWYLIDPASPYNKEAEPLMERAIYSDHMHH